MRPFCINSGVVSCSPSVRIKLLVLSVIHLQRPWAHKLHQVWFNKTLQWQTSAAIYLIMYQCSRHIQGFYTKHKSPTLQNLGQVNSIQLQCRWLNLALWTRTQVNYTHLSTLVSRCLQHCLGKWNWEVCLDCSVPHVLRLNVQQNQPEEFLLYWHIYHRNIQRNVSLVTRARASAHMHACTRTRARAHTHTCTHTHMHIYIVHIHSTHTHNTHTHTHTIHTHTHKIWLLNNLILWDRKYFY